MRGNLLKHLLCLSVVVIGCSGGGSDEDSGGGSLACNVVGLNPKATNQKVIGGTTCDESGSTSILRLYAVDANNNPIPMCTATLIAPDVVLTAAHCISSGMYGRYIVAAGELANPDVAEAIGYKVPSTYRFEASVNRAFDDVAVIKLNRQMNRPIAPILLSRSVAVGEPGFVYGYGIKDPNAGSSDFSTLEGGAMTIREVTPNHLFVSFDGSGVNVCNGDSGGPLVVLVNGQPAVAGVVSEGSLPGCKAGDVSTFTNLQSPSILPWLGQYVPEAYVRSANQ